METTYFYDTFLRLCKEKGEKPSAVVSKIGLSTPNATYWKRGSIPKYETIKKIADYFHVSLDFLLKHDRPYTRKEPGIELTSFLQDGSYKIFSRTPTQRDRKKLVSLIMALYGDEAEGKKRS